METLSGDPRPEKIVGYLRSRLEKMQDLNMIIDCTRNLGPQEYTFLQQLPASDATIERSFLMLGKVLRPDRPFADRNLKKYVLTYINST